ncbi:MAG: Fic family protein [Verrucomicrobiota bacterium]
MDWNWQLPDWPKFTFDPSELEGMEARFLREGGEIVGSFSHLDSDSSTQLRVELLTDEAESTSRIEGEILDRASVQSSLQKEFGMKLDHPRSTSQSERGIAELMKDCFQTHSETLTHEVLHRWHAKLMKGQLEDNLLGKYRKSKTPMQIISGDPFDPEIHFEAPPSSIVFSQMEEFINWFNASQPSPVRVPLPALTRSAIAHLHFETIHPYSDGNGRIGRAISEKALAQSLGQPTLLALSKTIEECRRDYYEALATTRYTSDWISWFGKIVLLSIEDTKERISFLAAKTHFFDRHRGALNIRQEKALNRMFREGPKRFEGGLSAGNYISITKTSPATARRDLNELVAIGALQKTGEKKGTRYFLSL